MVHKSELLAEQQRKKILEEKREKLFRSLAVIHSLSKVIQIAYYDAIKDSSFRSPKIKSKSDQINKFSEDIIKSLGDAVRLKSDFEEYMEYEHFTEIYECLRMLLFIDTESIRNISKLLRGEIKKTTEEEIINLN